MKSCPRCGAELGTPLACAPCNLLFEPEHEPSPFEVFGLEPAWEVDAGALRKRLVALSRLVHPDYFAAASAEQRALAERHSARINEAFETLGEDLARAEWMITSQGGPAEREQRDMPQAFLMEVLEWNEALDEARASEPGSAERARLDGLRAELEAARDAALGRLGARLAPGAGQDALVEARRELNALRYLRRTLDQIEALRLEQASSR